MTKIINFDDLLDPSPLHLSIAGKVHPLKPATFGGYLKSLKLIEAAGLNPSPVQELEIGRSLILEAFPTLSAEEVDEWQLAAIQRVTTIIRAANGEIVSTDEAQAADPGNVPTAS